MINGQPERCPKSPLSIYSVYSGGWGLLERESLLESL